MTKNSGKVIKRFSCPLMSSNTIRTPMYRLKSTEGEETLKTEFKLTHLKKNQSQKPRNCSNTKFALHLKGIMKKNRSYLLDFGSLYYFSVTNISTLI